MEEIKNEYEYTIEKHFGNLSERVNKAGVTVTKEVNRISYHGKDGVIDIRTWKRKDEDVRMFKGLTLTTAEAKALLGILKDMETNGVI